MAAVAAAVVATATAMATTATAVDGGSGDGDGSEDGGRGGGNSNATVTAAAAAAKATVSSAAVVVGAVTAMTTTTTTETTTKTTARMAAAVGDYESSNKEIRRWANGRPQNTEGPFELLENNSNCRLKSCRLKSNPTEDRLSESVEETSPQPPLIMVMGRSWSPSIYGAVRLLGNTVDVAWRMTFIHPLTFI
jgi:hypothetical protein